MRRAVRRFVVNEMQTNEVMLANQLLQLGRFDQAAMEYFQLANKLERIGKPRQSSNMHAQAALAWAKAGNEERALSQANIALRQFTLLRMPRRIYEFKTEFEQTLHPGKTANPVPPAPGSEDTATSVAAAPGANPSRGKLPAVCPKCGAPVRSDEVEWIDDNSAECDFCGAIIQSV
jgi:hypothetical protein